MTKIKKINNNNKNNYKSIDDNIVLTSKKNLIYKYFKGVIKDNQQIYTKGGKCQKPSIQIKL